MPEPDIDTPLVSRLIAAQFPRWAGLPITRVPSAGTDNAIYRLGDDMAVRLPRQPWVAATLTPMTMCCRILATASTQSLKRSKRQTDG